jgi:hypothetical protein
MAWIPVPQAASNIFAAAPWGALTTDKKLPKTEAHIPASETNSQSGHNPG